MLIKFKFSRKLRLLTPSCFSRVFRQTQWSFRQQITALGCLNSLGYPRIGLIVSKRHIKCAYKRNRIKRLIRESFRLHQHVLLSMDFVIVVTKEDFILNNCVFLNLLEKLWYHQNQLAHELL